jgi:hypothetical protein
MRRRAHQRRQNVEFERQDIATIYTTAKATIALALVRPPPETRASDIAAEKALANAAPGRLTASQTETLRDAQRAATAPTPPVAVAFAPSIAVPSRPTKPVPIRPRRAGKPNMRQTAAGRVHVGQACVAFSGALGGAHRICGASRRSFGERVSHVDDRDGPLDRLLVVAVVLLAWPGPWCCPQPPSPPAPRRSVRQLPAFHPAGYLQSFSSDVHLFDGHHHALAKSAKSSAPSKSIAMRPGQPASR